MKIGQDGRRKTFTFHPFPFFLLSAHFSYAPPIFMPRYNQWKSCVMTTHFLCH
jgi:hypothetical protein